MRTSVAQALSVITQIRPDLPEPVISFRPTANNTVTVDWGITFQILGEDGSLSEVPKVESSSADHVIFETAKFLASGAIFVYGKAPVRRLAVRWNGFGFVRGLALRDRANPSSKWRVDFSQNG